jgi:hypothetical protein
MQNNLDRLDFMSIRLALLEEYRQPSEMALALLAWYGAGAGSWQAGEYPLYETVPEQLLMELPMPILLAALLDNPLERSHLRGAARLFGGELFVGLRGDELGQLPESLKEAMSAEC